MLEHPRLFLSVATITVLGLFLWHRKSIKLERARAVSDEQRRVAATAVAPKAA